MIKITQYRKGLLAEFLAIVILYFKGYRILKHRLKTPVGEIDILARRGDLFVVVEVKYRKIFTQALDSVTAKQRRRLLRAALFVMARYRARQVRCDVFLVGMFWIKHIENAWWQE